MDIARPDEWEQAYIAIGSNLGDSFAALSEAVRMLDSVEGVRVTAVSPVYRTKPVGYTDQPDFLNGAVRVETRLLPEELLDVTQKIENDLGRVRTFRNGPRTIDLDILLYGRRKVDSDRLTIPHARMFERAFVLVPLADIIEGYGVTGKMIRDKAEGCSDKDDIMFYSEPFMEPGN